MGDIAPAIAIGAGIIIVYIAGTYAVQQNGKTIGTYPDLKTAQKNTQYLLDGIGSGLKWVWNGGAWVVEQGGRIFAKKARQVEPGEIIDTPDTKSGAFKKGKNEGQSGFEGKDGSWWEKDYAGSNSHGGSTWKRWPKKPNPKNKKGDPDRRTVGKDGKVIRR